MSTITKELAKLFRKITNSEIDAEGNAHVVLFPADILLINNARIALASLEAEAVAYMHHSGQVVTREECRDDKIFAICCKVETPLYAAPLLPQPAVLSVSEGVLKSLLPDVEKSEFWFEHNGKIFFEGVRFNNAVFEACRAAMLQGKSDGTLTNEGTIPSTQFKPVADLYGITSPTGSETSFTFDAVEARDFIDGGWTCQEYVELERFQDAMTNHSGDANEKVNSPAAQDGWVMVPKEINCAMDDAAWEAYHETRCMSDIWAALLAEAPQQEVKK